MRELPLTVTAAPGSGEGVTILVLHGPLTLQNSFDFQCDLSQHKPAVLILDLTDSPYMDSAGLGLLMTTTSPRRRMDASCCLRAQMSASTPWCR
jgi:anti-anti-sigma regulatory factor